MLSYHESIIAILGCTEEEAKIVKDIMQHEVFHSTLDWQTQEQFERGARKAWGILKVEKGDASA